jgi:hypothetical protein
MTGNMHKLQLISQLTLLVCVYTFFAKVSPLLAAVTAVAHITYEVTDMLIQRAMWKQIADAQAQAIEEANGGHC